MVPISCLAEFPNVVQMAKVGAPPPYQQHLWVPPHTHSSAPCFPLQLVCEDINVDRFYPVLYPKVSAVPGGQHPP